MKIFVGEMKGINKLMWLMSDFFFASKGQLYANSLEKEEQHV